MDFSFAACKNESKYAKQVKFSTSCNWHFSAILGVLIFWQTGYKPRQLSGAMIKRFPPTKGFVPSHPRPAPLTADEPHGGRVCFWNGSVWNRFLGTSFTRATTHPLQHSKACPPPTWWSSSPAQVVVTSPCAAQVVYRKSPPPLWFSIFVTLAV